MTDPGRQAAINVVAKVLELGIVTEPGDDDTWHPLAAACVNAAEAVWPHNPLDHLDNEDVTR